MNLDNISTDKLEALYGKVFDKYQASRFGCNYDYSHRMFGIFLNVDEVLLERAWGLR